MKKKILEVINLARSAENFIGDQFSYFSKNGDYEMHLICSNGPNLEELVKRHDIKYKVVPINRNITPWQDLKSLIAICKYIKSNKIDVIICHQEKGNLLGQTAGYLMRVPVRIVLSHGLLYETMSGMKRNLIKWQDKLVSCMATNVICVSHFVKEQRLKDGVDKQGKSIVLGHGSCNGIDTRRKFNPSLVTSQQIDTLREKYDIAKDDFVIGFCGRLVKDKGIVELLEAFTLLKAKYPHKRIKLLILGTFEERDALPEEVVQNIQESKSIILIESVPYSQIAMYYLLMSVFVLPTHREGLGLVSLEAQAMGVPALVTPFTGCKETIMEHKTGEYIDLTAKDICEKIELFIDRERTKEYSNAGRVFVEKNFDSSVVNKNMLCHLNFLTGLENNNSES